MLKPSTKTNQNCSKKCTEKTDKLNKAFCENNDDAIKNAHKDLEFELESLGILDHMSTFDETVPQKKPSKSNQAVYADGHGSDNLHQSCTEG